MDTSILAPFGWGCRIRVQTWPKRFFCTRYTSELFDVVSLCISTPADWPHSWRWSGNGRVWGVWAGCRVCCSSECTRDSGDHLGPPSAAVCCCCTRTEQEQAVFVRMQLGARAELKNPAQPVKSRCSSAFQWQDRISNILKALGCCTW